MIVVNFLLTLLFWIYVQIWIFIIALLSYPTALLPDSGRRFLYFLTRILLKFLFLVTFIRVKVSGRENLPGNGRSIFIANKPDLISTFALIAYLPRRVRFVADKKLFRQLFLGRLIKGIGCIMSVEEKSEAFGFAAAILSALRGDEPVLLYPKNLRRWDRKVGDFDQTEVKIAQIASASIIPLAITGTDKIIPEGSMIIYPGRVEINIRPVISDLNNIRAVTEELNNLYKSGLGG